MSERLNLSEAVTETEKFPVAPSAANRISALVAVAALSVLNGCVMPVDETESDENIDETEQELLANYTGSTSLLAPAYKTFNKQAGHRYTICLNPIYGNPDLYGHYTGSPTPLNYQYKSNKYSGADCIGFNAGSAGTYYLGVYNFPINGPGKTDMWITDSVQQNVPSGFSKALTWPLPGRTSLANNFSEFNSPWGNSASGNDPFFPGYTNYIHNGVDIAAPAGTPVKAACDGPIVTNTSGTNSSAGSGWGYYSVQECTKNGSTISVGYVHLASSGRAPINTQAVAGQTVIGKIYDMNVAGEQDHLHLGVCKDRYANCVSTGNKPQGGAMMHTSFPGKMVNPWITTNPGLYK